MQGQGRRTLHHCDGDKERAAHDGAVAKDELVELRDVEDLGGGWV